MSSVNQRSHLNVHARARPRSPTSALPTSPGCPRLSIPFIHLHLSSESQGHTDTRSKCFSQGPLGLSDGEVKRGGASSSPFPPQLMSGVCLACSGSLSLSSSLLLLPHIQVSAHSQRERKSVCARMCVCVCVYESHPPSHEPMPSLPAGLTTTKGQGLYLGLGSQSPFWAQKLPRCPPVRPSALQSLPP